MAEIIFFLSTGPVGYIIGRTGHVFGGHLKTPHHWIYGLGLVIFGVFAVFSDSQLGIPSLFFGSGLFISDLKDFLALKVYGVDEDGPKYFWGID